MPAAQRELGELLISTQIGTIARNHKIANIFDKSSKDNVKAINQPAMRLGAISGKCTLKNV